ncbi:MAG: hypothetical protein ABI995_02245 [Acidobacteriota bacterium]
MDKATEQQANLARDEHQDTLISGGAHAISVEQSAGKGNVNFSVVAWVDPKKRKASLPSSLEIEQNGKTVRVPLIVREAKPFAPE